MKGEVVKWSGHGKGLGCFRGFGREGAEGVNGGALSLFRGFGGEV